MFDMMIYHTQNIIFVLTMTQLSTKQRISITVDAKLLKEIDLLTENRSAAVEEGLRLWHHQRIEEQLRTFYQNLKPTEQQFEQDWGELAQNQMEEILEAEGL
jgi:hypothetical protein